MKILHLRASNFYGGPERQIHLHARMAMASEFDLVVGSYEEGGRSPAFLERSAADGVRTQLFRVRSAYDPSAFGRLRDFCSKEQLDLVCTHDYRSAVLACVGLRGTRTRWIAFSRGSTADNLKVRAFHRLEHFIQRFARHVVAVSGSQREKLLRAGIEDRKITVVANAIARETVESVTAVDLRARHGFPADSLVVVSGGRFSREKGQLDLVKAAELALMVEPRLRFLLFGDGPDLASAQSAVQERGLADRVVCPGFETDMLGCLKGADVLVNPSLSEGMPNIVLEAMGLGTLVVATEVGGLPELIDDGVHGVLVPSQAPAAMADALRRIASDAGLRERLADAGRERVEREFTFDGQMQKLASVYKTVAAG